MLISSPKSALQSAQLARPGWESGDPPPGQGDEGFMLLTALVMVFLVLLALSVAAPRMARAIQHDRELESQHRAEQYVRAVRIFYLKFKRYPTSIEQLEKTNNQRFLRQRYVDPLTGKDDWRIIHQGENQTTVKGFFGDDLPGLPTGLGSAAGLASSTGSSAFGGSSTGSPGSSAFGGSTTAGGSGLGGSGLGGSGLGGSGTSAFGGGTTPGQSGTSAFGQSGTGTGATGTGTTGTSSGTNGIASQDATTFGGSGGGPIIGIGSAKSGEAMLVVNEQTTYETWEFLYDPRIEQLYSKASLLGGIGSGSGSSSGFGSSSGTTGTSNGFGNPGSLGFGANGNSGSNGLGSSGFGSPGSGNPTAPTTPAPGGTTPP